MVFILNLGYEITTLGFVALGLGIVFGFLRVLNMAHGEFVMLGAYTAFFVQQSGWSLLLSVPISILLCGGIALVIERTMIRFLYHRPFDTLLATWGLSILLRKSVESYFGKGYQNFENPFQRTLIFGGIQYPTYRLVFMTLIILLFTGLWVWYRKSRVAARLKAMLENPTLAQAVGINTGQLACLSFVFATIITSLAGVMLAPLVRIDPYMGMDYLLNAFFVLIVGGLGSIEGLVLGSSVIAGVETGISSLLDQTFGYAGVLIISIFFLWLKPSGLFSRRTS